MKELYKLQKWEPYIHIILWTTVLLFPYIKFLEREGGYPHSLAHEINAMIFIMIPCYNIYYWILRLQNVFFKIVLAFSICLTSAFAFDYTDSFFHDEHFQPFTWKQLFSSTIKYAAFSLFFVVLFYVKALFREQERLNMVSQKKQEAEQDSLKAQVTPHFLFNTLNVLYRDALLIDKNLAASIMTLANNTRYFLKEGQQSSVTLAQEIMHIEDYIHLQKHRLKNKVRVSFQKNVTNDQNQIVPLLLIPFVENAFKHSANIRGQNIPITINILEKNGTLEFKCSNPYQKMNGKGIKSGLGIGIANIRSRLALCYPKRHVLKIIYAKDYSVHLKIIL